MTLTISKCKLSKQQHTITLNYTLGENEKNSLIFTLMICRNFFAHRNAVCKTRDGLAHLIKVRALENASLVKAYGLENCLYSCDKCVSYNLVLMAKSFVKASNDLFYLSCKTAFVLC